MMKRKKWNLASSGLSQSESDSGGDEGEEQIQNEDIESKCAWSPFNGFKFKGTPVLTIISGKIKMRDGKILGEPEGSPLRFS